MDGIFSILISLFIMIYFILLGFGLVFFLYKLLTRTSKSRIVYKENQINPAPQRAGSNRHEIDCIFLSVAGARFKSEITKKPRQSLYKELSEGEIVLLERDYANQYDDNAILVNTVLGDDLGYIFKEDQEKLLQYLDQDGFEVEAEVYRFYETHGDLINIKLKIKIFEVSE